jgi:dihydroflavonol-4-reductase
MTIAITGAAGHVGTNLARALIEKGHRPRCIVHTHTQAIEGLNVEIMRGDIGDVEFLCRAFAGVDTVYHLAAAISITMNEWPLVEKINVQGTRNVVEACLRAKVRRLVHFSSIHAMVQEPMNTPVDEMRPLATSRRLPPYDRSKSAAEKEVQQGISRGLDAVIVNPTAVMGPYDFQPSHLGAALIAIAQRQLPAMVQGGFDWVDVRDVAAGAILAAEKAPVGGRYLLSGHWVSMCDMSEMIAEITGVDTKKPVCPLWLAQAGAPIIQGMSKISGKRPLYTSVSLKALKSNRDISHDRAARELGYQPRLFMATLTDTLRWFKENGQLNCPVK